MKLNLDIRTYLEQARKNGTPVREMMAHLGKSESTVQRYLNALGLTSPSDLDLPAETVRDMYEQGMTCNAIATELGISHDSVTKRLAVFGIKPGRAENIRKHFNATYDARWPEAKALLDSGKLFTTVCGDMSMRPENLKALMEKNGWKRPAGPGYDVLVEAFENLLSDPGLNAKKQRAAKKYFDGIVGYYSEHAAVPTASQLSRYMGLSVQTVSWWLNKNGFMPLMGAEKQSYLLAAVLELLDGKGVRYMLNRRDLIAPYEIDVWLYDYAAGIEVNPVTTHSPDAPRGKRDELYHQRKSLAAIKAGIPLCHVYDTDMPGLEGVNDWVVGIMSHAVHTGPVVDLDRFLYDAPSDGKILPPWLFWCNRNTGKCSDRQENASYARVYTAGSICVE